MKSVETFDYHMAKPFLIAGLVWLFLAGALSVGFNSPEHGYWWNLRWTLTLCGVCLFDLYALAKAVSATLALASEDKEKRGPLIVQASYWGMVKLVCLGILGAILFRGAPVPTLQLMMGSATLIVVPVVGGYWWSRKVLRHA
jgi:hypothetical protein